MCPPPAAITRSGSKGLSAQPFEISPAAINRHPYAPFCVLVAPPPCAPLARSSPARVRIQDLQRFQKDGAGYQEIQGTKPQSLAYGLTDSPAGLAA